MTLQSKLDEIRKRLICYWFDHNYGQQAPQRIIAISFHYLFEDKCIVCGHVNRFWNTAEEMGEL